jgi:hypothetical protein
MRSEPLHVLCFIDLVDDDSMLSEFFYLTGDSEGQLNVALKEASGYGA